MAVNPLQNPELYDSVEIGDREWPLCEVSGFVRAHEWDQKKGKGGLGATITFVQRPAAKGSIKFFLWLPEHWEQWDEFVQQLQYDPTRQAPKPVDIYNPKLARLKINSVVTENIGQEEDEGLKLFSIKVDFLEYFAVPAKSSVSTPDGSTGRGAGGNASGTQPDPAADAQQQQIAALLKQAQSP